MSVWGLFTLARPVLARRALARCFGRTFAHFHTGISTTRLDLFRLGLGRFAALGTTPALAALGSLFLSSHQRRAHRNATDTFRRGRRSRNRRGAGRRDRAISTATTGRFRLAFGLALANAAAHTRIGRLFAFAPSRDFRSRLLSLGLAPRASRTPSTPGTPGTRARARTRFRLFAVRFRLFAPLLCGFLGLFGVLALSFARLTSRTRFGRRGRGRHGRVVITGAGAARSEALARSGLACALFLIRTTRTFVAVAPERELAFGIRDTTGTQRVRVHKPTGLNVAAHLGHAVGNGTELIERQALIALQKFTIALVEMFQGILAIEEELGPFAASALHIGRHPALLNHRSSTGRQRGIVLSRASRLVIGANHTLCILLYRQLRRLTHSARTSPFAFRVKVVDTTRPLPVLKGFEQFRRFGHLGAIGILKSLKGNSTVGIVRRRGHFVLMDREMKRDPRWLFYLHFTSSQFR